MGGEGKLWAKGPPTKPQEATMAQKSVLSISLDTVIVSAVQARASEENVPVSRIVNELLIKGLRSKRS